MTWNDLYDYNNKCKDYDERILCLARSSMTRDVIKVSNKIQQLICTKCEYLLSIERLQKLYSSLSIEMQQIIELKYNYKMNELNIGNKLGISRRTVFRRMKVINDCLLNELH